MKILYPSAGNMARFPRGFLALALVAAWALTGSSAEAGYREGEQVEVRGVVTDTDGNPVPGVEVVLEASRSRLKLRTLSREQRDRTRLSSLTDERGRYSIQWHWNRYYNTFELIAGVPVRQADGGDLQPLERLDITRRLERSNPLVTPLVVEDAEYIATVRKFLASLSTDDENRIYQQMGKPDRVEEQVSSQREEAAWWYFESGHVFRFVDGSLVSDERFSPVKPF
ncbi:MAG: carboxypeptidase-like regulatory domain-containing protein [Acidobacteriota bacterium]